LRCSPPFFRYRGARVTPEAGYSRGGVGVVDHDGVDIVDVGESGGEVLDRLPAVNLEDDLDEGPGVWCP
jgi:hypothetical protein